MSALDVFDTGTLRELLAKINSETQNGIMEIKTNLKRHELEIYNKWKSLYKKCNPVDYLINSSNTLGKTKCLQNCYENIGKFSTFIQNNYRTLIGMLGMYDSYSTRLKTSAENVDSIVVRIKFLESEINKVISKFKLYISNFCNIGILYVTPLSFYKLYDFIYDFTGEQLKLPILYLDDTLNRVTIYPNKNNINSSTNTATQSETALCDTRLYSSKATDDNHESTPVISVAQQQTPTPVISDNNDDFDITNTSFMDIDEISDVQLELMSIDSANSWFEDELKPTEEILDGLDDVLNLQSVPIYTDQSLFYKLHSDEAINEVLVDRQEAIEYSKIIYGKLLTPDYNIIDNAEIKNYVTMIRMYLRSLYHEKDMREDARGLRVSLPEYLRKAFKVIPVCGDGSCFYSALSVQMIGDSSLSDVLRVIIVYHMKINESWILQNFDIDLKEYTTFDDLVQKSLSSNEYIDGGYPPVMMSIILDKPINIYGYAEGTFLRINSWVFQSLRAYRADQLSEFYIYLHENHYTALELLTNDTSNIPPLDDYKVDVFSTFALV